jgi:hypothetical protein
MGVWIFWIFVCSPLLMGVLKFLLIMGVQIFTIFSREMSPSDVLE